MRPTKKKTVEGKSGEAAIFPLSVPIGPFPLDAVIEFEHGRNFLAYVCQYLLGQSAINVPSLRKAVERHLAGADVFPSGLDQTLYSSPEQVDEDGEKSSEVKLCL